METTRQRIVRVTWRAGAGDERYECPTWMSAFTITVDEATAEFDDAPGRSPREALLTITVAGERYRHLKAGPKPVGRASIAFGPHTVPPALGWLLHILYDATVLDSATVAQRHAERKQRAS